MGGKSHKFVGKKNQESKNDANSVRFQQLVGTQLTGNKWNDVSQGE